MVSLGTMFSSFWILANDSGMQVPLGHTIVDGTIIPADWLAITAGPTLFFVAAYLTLGMMFWPYMVRYSVTVANAAAPDVSLSFFFYRGRDRASGHSYLHDRRLSCFRWQESAGLPLKIRGDRLLRRPRQV
jgi:cytochrome bd ubiquinol oxidase subunit I